jgi:hypothetical protein
MLVSLHQHGELVLWPWWDTKSPAPNSAGLETIGRKLASYNGYTAGPGATTLYDASGTTDDWGYGVLGVPSYTFEVGREFLPAYPTVDSTLWPENSEALLYAAKIARTPYLTAYGPDADAVAVTGVGSRFAVTASIDDTANGGETIAAAEFYVDTPPWRSGAVAHALAATDGSFDSSVEQVTAALTVEGAGSHVVYVRGQDATGQWGPFSAGLLTSVPPARWWHNAANPFDVNGLNGVQPLDVLIIINAINAQGARLLQAPAPGSGSPPPFLDVTGDDWLTPEDALRVIDYLNGGGSAAVAAEGEPGGVLLAYPIDVLATDAATPSRMPADSLMAIWPEPAIRAKKSLPPSRCAPAERTGVSRRSVVRAYEFLSRREITEVAATPVDPPWAEAIRESFPAGRSEPRSAGIGA